MTGAIAWFAGSNPVRSEEPMQPPFDGLESSVAFACNAQGEWVGIRFSKEPRLRRTRSRWLRTRWDGTVIAMEFDQEPGTALLEFVDFVVAVRLLKQSESVLAEFPWHGEGMVYFHFSLTGSRSAIGRAQQNCEALREEERSRAHEQKRLDQERKALFAKTLEEHIGAIQSSVTRNWRRPTGVPAGLKCTVSVMQANNGKVLRVEITQSSGNVAFDRSVEQAVLAASPLPPPPPEQRALFNREIIFVFPRS